MTDALTVELEDTELLGEIELVAALMVAAQAADRELTQTAVDAILRAPETVT
jgi:hypothetical protein